MSYRPPYGTDGVFEPRTLSARTLLASLVISLGVVVLLSILVGYVGPKPGFQWDLASIFGTALGTTLLAAATGALAYSTWTDMRADVAGRHDPAGPQDASGGAYPSRGRRPTAFAGR